MADTFWIYLKNLTPGSQYYWGEGTMFAVGNILSDYITESCMSSGGRFGSADFTWEPQSTSIEDYELVLYVLPKSGDSIAAAYSSSALGASGSTLPTNDGVISEIYLDVTYGDGDLARLIANIAYHELLHNKLDSYLDMKQAVVKDIHTQGGGGLAVSTPITSSHRPSKQNIALLAKALSKVHPQYTSSSGSSKVAGLATASPYP